MAAPASAEQPSASPLVDAQLAEDLSRRELFGLYGAPECRLSLNPADGVVSALYEEARGMGERPVFTIAAFGDTRDGKSFLLDQLATALGGVCAVRPHHIGAGAAVPAGQPAVFSTTANSRVFACEPAEPSRPVTLLVDMEGENGTATAEPGSDALRAVRQRRMREAMRQEAMHGVGIADHDFAGVDSSSPAEPSAASAVSQAAEPGGTEAASVFAARREAVSRAFPVLAYTTSDVVMLVGSESSVAAAKYVQRCTQFAEIARAGVGSAAATLPFLVVVHNKCSDAVSWDMATSTAEFNSALTTEARAQLECAFSGWLFVRLPVTGKKPRFKQKNAAKSFVEIFDEGIKALAAALTARQEAGLRAVHVTYRAWLDLVGLVIGRVRIGKPVHVYQLVLGLQYGDDDTVGFVVRFATSLLQSMPVSLTPAARMAAVRDVAFAALAGLQVASESKQAGIDGVTVSAADVASAAAFSAQYEQAERLAAGLRQLAMCRAEATQYKFESGERAWCGKFCEGHGPEHETFASAVGATLFRRMLDLGRSKRVRWSGEAERGDADVIGVAPSRVEYEQLLRDARERPLALEKFEALVESDSPGAEPGPVASALRIAARTGDFIVPSVEVDDGDFNTLILYLHVVPALCLVDLRASALTSRQTCKLFEVLSACRLMDMHLVANGSLRSISCLCAR